MPTMSLIIPSPSRSIHRSEWRPTLDDAHPFKSNYPITPPGSPEASLPLPPPLQAMTALPSFVELMASLGLDSNKPSPSSTQEFSSPAIVVSSEHEPTQEYISSRIRVARYSPYGAPIVSVFACTRSNRSSLPSPTLTEGVLLRFLAMEQTPNSPTEYVFAIPNRFFWSLTLPQTTSPRHRPSALKLGPESRHRHVSDPESSANMPISTFVRRKTPTSSPVSPTFAHRTRRRSQSPTINPVSLPTLPPVFVSHVPHRSDGSCISPPPAESDDENNLVTRRADRLTPDYSFAEDRHVVISPFPRNNLVQDPTSRCVSPLA